MIIYLASTLDLMISKGLDKEVQDIVDNSECIKLEEHKIFYFKLKEVENGD